MVQVPIGPGSDRSVAVSTGAPRSKRGVMTALRTTESSPSC
jgi:hypothetical protein